MACDQPLTAYRSLEKGASGKPLLTFNPLKALNSTNPMKLPCGRCTGCRLEKSRQWAVRCMHEAQMHPENSFITLTFSREHLPSDYSVDVRHFQLFMKKLRFSVGTQKIRFYACGEYGDQNLRPHYHSILFNKDFADKDFYERTPQGDVLYTSKELSKLWPYGLATLGDVTFNSAAYVARYCLKKFTNSDPQKVSDHYTRIHPDTNKAVTVRPEFTVMSRRPGIGATWLSKYKSDAYPSDFIIARGHKMKPPRFYDQQLNEEELEPIKRRRKAHGVQRKPDNTPRRLATKAIVRDAKISTLKRKL